MSEGIKRGLIITLILALGAVAVAGWTRTPEPALAQTDQAQVQMAYADPAARPRVVTRYATPAPRATVVRRSRPLKKSVAIVAGSAGVGAAIGALAGGGKGAAIGALSGGTAGFIYDRLTHRR